MTIAATIRMPSIPPSIVFFPTEGLALWVGTFAVSTIFTASISITLHIWVEAVSRIAFAIFIAITGLLFVTAMEITRVSAGVLTLTLRLNFS